MTYEEAVCKIVDRPPDREAVRLAIIALDKQVPMRPFCATHPYRLMCSSCEKELDSFGWKFCPYCGHAINWDDIIK